MNVMNSLCVVISCGFLFFGFPLFGLFETGFFLYNSSGHPGNHSVHQAGLELTEIHLPLPPDCWDAWLVWAIYHVTKKYK